MSLIVNPDFADEFDARMELRKRMIAALDIVLPRYFDSKLQALVRQTLVTCATCRRTNDCAKWLESRNANSRPPDFCPSRRHFEELLAL